MPTMKRKYANIILGSILSSLFSLFHKNGVIMKRRGIFWLGLILFLLLAGVAGYSQLSESKKRYLRYLSSQLPHLVFRYFV